MSLESGNTREGESHTHKSTASNRQTPRRTAEKHGERGGGGKDWWGEEVRKDGGTLWWKETGAELSLRCFLFLSQWVIRILWGFPADSAFGPWALFVVGSHNSYGRVRVHLTRSRCVVIKQGEPSWFSHPWTVNHSRSLDFPLWKLTAAAAFQELSTGGTSLSSSVRPGDSSSEAITGSAARQCMSTDHIFLVPRMLAFRQSAALKAPAVWP